MDTLYQFREEYNEFQEDDTKPYMERIKQHLEETRTKYKEEDKPLKQFQEFNKQENRKTLEPAEKKN